MGTHNLPISILKKKKKKEMVLNHPKSNLQLWDFPRDSRTSSKELW